MRPIYLSTGIHFAAALLVGASIQGSVKRTKYHEESTNVSIVSVSRCAGLAHFGQETFFQVGCRSRGLPGRSKATSSGSRTGSSETGTGTTPQSSQWITGIGQPQ